MINKVITSNTDFMKKKTLKPYVRPRLESVIFNVRSTLLNASVQNYFTEEYYEE